MLKADETSGTILFEEKQKYPQWIMWIIAVCMFLAIVAVLVTVITTNEKNDVVIGLVVIIPVTVIVIYLSLNIGLEIVVTSNGFYYRWKPLHRKFRVIEKEEIGSANARKFPLLSYGSGWFPGYGWYYNVGGNEGVQLYLKNGRRLFFSAYDKMSLQNALQNLISANVKPGNA